MLLSCSWQLAMQQQVAAVSKVALLSKLINGVPVTARKGGVNCLCAACLLVCSQECMHVSVQPGDMFGTGTLAAWAHPLYNRTPLAPSMYVILESQLPAGVSAR